MSINPHVILVLCIMAAFLIAGSVDVNYRLQNESPVPGAALSPANSEFVQFYKDTRVAGIGQKTIDNHPLGYVPSPVDLSHTKGTRVSRFDDVSANIFEGRFDNAGILAEMSDSKSTTPSRFDLRTTGKLSPVKDQGQCGSCWAFSTYASLESTLLPGEAWDFSENNMKNSHGYDLSPCYGGNSIMSTAYLARWSGAVLESADPYRPAAGSSLQGSPVVKHIQDVWFIPARSGSLDNDNIKRALQEKGAVYSTVRWEDSSYSASRASYYYKGSSMPNHAVTIVGWDDSYDRNKFSSTPPGNGAFIVKNSWGSNWGENGYFYISYYDSVIGKDNALFLGESPDNYYHVYQYDPLGWVANYGANSDTAYFANIYAAQTGENLAAVSFYTAATDSRYQVWVYRDVRSSPVAGSAVTTESGTLSIPGYHTVRLSSPVPLSAGQKFSVVVRLTTPGYRYPVAIEYPYSGFSSQVSARTGESFVSSNGISWSDISQTYTNTNVCLKAFTMAPGQVQTTVPTATPTTIPPTQVIPSATPTLTPTPTPSPASGFTDRISPTVTISIPQSYSTITPGQNLGITWSSKDNKAVSSVRIDYSITRGSSWSAISSGLGQTGSYTWAVPDSVPAGSLTLKVTASDTSGNTGSSSRVLLVRSVSSSRTTLAQGAGITDISEAQGIPEAGTQIRDHSITACQVPVNKTALFDARRTWE